MSAHDDLTIDRALRAMGRALAKGADHKTAMRAALDAAASTGCLREYSVTVDTVSLVVGFDGDIEDGWIIQVAPGTDLSPMLSTDSAIERIDRAVCAAMARESEREVLDRIEERHAEMRALAEVL